MGLVPAGLGGLATIPLGALVVRRRVWLQLDRAFTMGVAHLLLRALGSLRFELVLGAVASVLIPARRLLGAEELGLRACELLLTPAAEPLVAHVPRRLEPALADCGRATY